MGKNIPFPVPLEGGKQEPLFMKKRMLIPVPLESEEQEALFTWAETLRFRHPELKLLFHVPNGGRRGKAEAARFKAEGVKSGVPDIYLPVARGQWHGLFIELKRMKHSKTSSNQEKWLAALKEQGYAAIVCRGWRAAASMILTYLMGVHFCDKKTVCKADDGRGGEEE